MTHEQNFSFNGASNPTHSHPQTRKTHWIVAHESHEGPIHQIVTTLLANKRHFIDKMNFGLRYKAELRSEGRRLNVPNPSQWNRVFLEEAETKRLLSQLVNHLRQANTGTLRWVNNSLRGIAHLDAHGWR